MFLLSGADARSLEQKQVVISGIGYPPVKADNKAQALLMARRAAVLDAYRNALRSHSNSTESNREGSYYEGLVGFVKGMTIIGEEYLKDGGIKITASVSASDILVPPKSEDPLHKRIGKNVPTQYPGPVIVTIEEWFKIIEKIVTFEANSLIKGNK